MIILGNKSSDRKLNPDIIKHNSNVGVISQIICESLDMTCCDSKIVNCSAIYHDIGKRDVDQSILYKPSKLDSSEYKEVKKHARYGYSEMQRNPYLRNYAKYVLYHHENFNGGGYNNLKGSDIPFPSRILRLADYLAALCEDRPYSDALSVEKALCIIEKDSKVFDPKIYSAFMNYIESNTIEERLLEIYDSKKILAIAK